MPRVCRRFALIAAVALTLSACLSPTLPLPPPSKPVVEGPDSQGMVTLSGNVPGRAEAIAANLDTGEIRGQITGPNGAYKFQIPAAVGNEIAFWYSVGTDESPPIVFRINAPP